MSEGPIIGEGFVHKGADGVIRGAGKWCGFPFVVELQHVDEGARRGYRLVMHAAPQPGEDSLVDELLGLPYTIKQPVAKRK